MDTPETPTTRRSALPFILGAVLIAILAGAAFVAFRYFNQAGSRPVAGAGPEIVSISGPGGAAQTFSLNVKPAPQLPTTQPDVVGVFVERKDNSVFVGTGNIEFIVRAEPGQEPQADSSFSGDKIEVVISPDTVIYRDATNLDPDDPEDEMQQVVEESTINEITDQSSISAWGRKVGDRIIADVVVFSTPFLMRAPGAP